jgi:hypothetical protein
MGEGVGGVRSFVRRLGEDKKLSALLVLVAALLGTVAYALILEGKAHWSPFKGEPLRDWLVWKLAAMWALGLFLAAACVSTGFVFLTRVFRVGDLPTIETLVGSAALGLVVFTLGMYAAGFAHQFHAAFAILLPSIMFAAGARPLAAFLRERHDAWQSAPPVPRNALSDGLTLLALAFGLYGLVFVYLGVLTPVAINFDALWIHLPIAADYARRGSIVPFYGDYDRALPQLASLLHTWAMLVPSCGVLTVPPLRWMLALHLEFFVFVGTLAGVSAMTAFLLETPRARGAWAAFFLFPAIFVYDKHLGGASDHDLAFFGPPLFLAAVRAAPRFEARASALAGAYAGGALLCKYQAIYLLLGVATVYVVLWVNAAKRRDDGSRAPLAKLAVGPLVAAAVIVVVTAPHFLKNWAYYGNPVYPFLQDVLGGHPTHRKASYLFEWIFKDYVWRPHGGLLQNVRQSLGLLLSWSIAPHYSFTNQVPDGGALFTLCLPILFALPTARRILLGYGAGMACLFAWAMVFRVDRHIQSFMPLLAAATAAVLVRAWELGTVARVGLVPLVGLQVLWSGDAPFYGGRERLVATTDMIASTYDGKAGTRFASFQAAERALGASLPADARVLLHELKPSLGIDRDVVLDVAGRQGLIFYEDVHGPRGLHELYRSLGITHLVRLPDWRPAATKQAEVLFSDYVHRYAGTRRTFIDREVATLAREPPPPDHPYKVLSLGLAGYADGLYAVEAMNTYETVLPAPGTHETYAPPEQALPSDPAAQAALAEVADAVCVGAEHHLDPLVQSELEAGFEVAANHSTFAIHVRRGGPGGKPAGPPLLILPPVLGL